MSDHAPPAPAAPAGKKKFPIALLALPLVAAGGGAAVPLVVDVPAMMGKKAEDPDAKKKKHAKHEHTACVPVGDVTVNVNEDRVSRFLQIKFALECEAAAEPKVKEHAEKNKAALKSWLISHLAGKNLAEIKGQVAIQRLQREMLERYDDMLYPEGESPLRGVLFESYVIQ